MAARLMVPAITLLVSLTMTPALTAQSVSGNLFVSARCDRSDTIPVALGDDRAESRHGECLSSRFGGFASVNDAIAHWSIFASDIAIDLNAHTNFFGTPDGSGSATANTNMTFAASDLVFTDTTNPGSTRTVPVALNFLLRHQLSTQGASNCDAFHPSASASLIISGASNLNTLNSFSPGAGPQGSGPLASIPHDAQFHAFTADQASIALGSPVTITIIIGVNTDVLDCDRPPAEVQDAHTALAWRLPCGSPVFNLPPGITVNSPQLGIVNNAWTGAACCPPDINHDGTLNSADFFDFVTAFFTGAPSADFNHDSQVNSQDFFDFLAAFFAGC